ncbi:dynein light chain Tctex-type 5-like [Athalia rosae]|uniref:dynein light chain Tctex-type 5-like n=1 Tax=Athalia rosae TaxID=37344 RepID=UPI0020335450|nr:dynein light chain Tctex-type 5-like [Athalia rosae]
MSTVTNSSNMRLSLISRSQRGPAGAAGGGTSSMGRTFSQQSKIGLSTASLIPGHLATSATYRNTKGGFKIPKYQNSYRLNAYNPFKHEAIDKILEEVITTTLTGMKYNPEVCMKLCQDMTAEIRNRVYRKDYDRYKFIVQVTIIEKTGQSVNVATGRLWDVERDGYSTFTFESPQMYAVGIVVGLYYE